MSSDHTIDVFWLHAVSSCGTHSASFPVAGNEQVLIGRSNSANLQIPWDPVVSRRHASASLRAGKAHVRRLPEGRNPLHLGDQVCDELVIGVGDDGFRIGETRVFLSGTAELVSRRRAGDVRQLQDDAPPRVQTHESSFRLGDLRAPVSPDRVALLENLPDLVSRCGSGSDLSAGIAQMLLESIPAATAVAAIQCADNYLEYDSDLLQMLPTSRIASSPHFKDRFNPSKRLIHQSLKTGNAIVHHWDGENSSLATMSCGLNWAFSVPLSMSGAHWVLYVSGESSTGPINQSTMKADLRFTQVLGRFLSSIQNIRRLQEQTTRLSSFFSPNVVRSITDRRSVELPEQTVTEVAVLFCDVRGFSRRSEQFGENLTHLLDCAREALGLMTGAILDHDGSIADFQGDAVLGFWGWPMQLNEGAIPAVRAGLRIISRLNRESSQNPMLGGLSAGIGIATGTAVAGHIGTDQLAKIGVFGPVVNQGSRLEGMTRLFGVSMVVDDPTANLIQQVMPAETASVRNLGLVRPAGMATVVNVWEVFDGEEMNPQRHADHELYAAGYGFFRKGNWSKALKHLALIPHDGPAAFLTSYIEQYGPTPPDSWNGVIQLDRK